MNIIRLFRLGSRVVEWAAPHVQEWHRLRHLHRTEGQRHLKSRNWSEAEEHLKAALAERKHAAKHEFELIMGIAQAQHGKGNHAEAEQTARAAFDFGRASRNHDWQMQGLEALTDVQLTQQNYAGAQQTAEHILSQEGARKTPDKARMASAGRKLGLALAKAGQTQQAIAALDRAVTLSEEGHGPKHLETAACLSDLGALHNAQGNHEQAQRYLRRGLDIYRAESRLDSHEATSSLFQLAESLVASGRTDDACSEFERALTIKEQQVGGNPDEVADAQMNLAALYLHVDKTSAARELLLRGIGNLERRGGERLKRAYRLLIEAEEQACRPADAWRAKLAKLEPAPAPEVPTGPPPIPAGTV